MAWLAWRRFGGIVFSEKAEEHLCPRRSEVGPQFRLPDHDTWDRRDGAKGPRTCSYCGSLHPEDFFILWIDDGEIGPTDKNYKAYLRHPISQTGQFKFYFMHLDEAQRHRWIDTYNEIPETNRAHDDSAGTYEPGPGPRVGFPGYFYQRPFFCAPGRP